MFSLVSGRYERSSLIVTSNQPFSAWGEIFGDETTAVAMTDRLVHNESATKKQESPRGNGWTAHLSPRRWLDLSIEAHMSSGGHLSPGKRQESAAA
jgi:hypothetical protein